MTGPVSRALKAVFDAAKQKDWTTAKAKLAEAQEISNPTGFDRFEIDIAASFVAINTADHPTMLASYKVVIANPLFITAAVTPQDRRDMLRNAMILSNEANDFPGAIAYGEKLIAMGAIDDASATTLAVAYFGNKDYARAESLAQSAINTELAAGQKPNDSAVQIVEKSKAMVH